MKRNSLALGALFALATTATAATHGIDPGDMNRSANACTDFFDYANGAWRKAHPIPAYMDRWSRRWESGEVNKEHVRDILAQVSARSDWPAGSAEQLSGDFYAACSNAAQANQLGVKPVQPLLDEIAAIKTRADVQRVIGDLQGVGVNVGFSFYANQDLHEPTQMVAQVDAGGLGMPDRDYYLKTEPHFVEARAKYHEHLTKMFTLAGSKPAAAEAAANAVFAFEKRLAEASLDNVALRDPVALDHKTTFDALVKLAPDFDWASYFDGVKAPRIDLNITQPKFVQEFDHEMATAAIAQ